MNLSMIRYILGNVLAVEGLLMAPCSIVGYLYGEAEAQIYLIIGVCSLLLGKGADGTGTATSEGIQATALVACIFVACALGIYFFYNDKEIAATIRKANEEAK